MPLILFFIFFLLPSFVYASSLTIITDSSVTDYHFVTDFYKHSESYNINLPSEYYISDFYSNSLRSFYNAEYLKYCSSSVSYNYYYSSSGNYSETVTAPLNCGNTLFPNISVFGYQYYFFVVGKLFGFDSFNTSDPLTNACRDHPDKECVVGSSRSITSYSSDLSLDIRTAYNNVYLKTFVTISSIHRSDYSPTFLKLIATWEGPNGSETKTLKPWRITPSSFQSDPVTDSSTWVGWIEYTHTFDFNLGSKYTLTPVIDGENPDDFYCSMPIHQIIVCPLPPHVVWRYLWDFNLLNSIKSKFSDRFILFKNDVFARLKFDSSSLSLEYGHQSADADNWVRDSRIFFDDSVFCPVFGDDGGDFDFSHMFTPAFWAAVRSLCLIMSSIAGFRIVVRA